MREGKRVRDKIPESIRAKGQVPRVYTAGAEEYAVRLRDKLGEAVTGFLADGDLEKLADILEVVYALAEQGGTSRERLEMLRAAKATERGRFAERIIWLGNEPADDDDGSFVVLQGSRDYGLCQGCLKTRATIIKEGVPYCKECVDTYDTGSTTGRPE